MTREEILSLTAGRELDCQVAERVMGDVLDAEGWWASADGSKCSYADDGPRPYSTSIGAAWKVVERMCPGVEYWFDLYNGSQPGQPDTWISVFHQSAGKVLGEAFEAKAPSAPEAICKAALLAVTKG
jgi:hypothetical protein